MMNVEDLRRTADWRVRAAMDGIEAALHEPLPAPPPLHPAEEALDRCFNRAHNAAARILRRLLSLRAATR